MARPVFDLSDLEFNLEDDLVGQNEFDFRDQRPSIDLRNLGYFEASRYSMLKTNLNTTLTSRTLQTAEWPRPKITLLLRFVQ